MRTAAWAGGSDDLGPAVAVEVSRRAHPVYEVASRPTIATWAKVAAVLAMSGEHRTRIELGRIGASLSPPRCTAL